MATALNQVIYTARAQTTGGREGSSRSDDGLLDIKLTRLTALVWSMRCIRRLS